MSLLSQVVTGKIDAPHFVLIYGPDGVGKTSFAAAAPKPIFLGTEEGTNSLDVARFPVMHDFDEASQAIKELTDGKHDYQTLAVDSIDWLETLVWKKVCKTHGQTSIEDFGYGKGYAYALQVWKEWIESVKALRRVRKMNVVFVAHSQVKTFNDPSQTAAYDRHQLKLNDKAGALFREAVDAVFFATYETFVKEEKGKKAKAFGDGKRVIFTERRPGFDAKNRMGLPFEIPLSWNDYVAVSANSNPDQVKIICSDIEELIEGVTDLELKKIMQKAYVDAGKDPQRLREILNRIRTRLGG